MAVLETELKTYEENREKLLAEAEGKYVLIHGEDVLGVYESQMDAISAGYENLGEVPFLTKQILRVDEPIEFHPGLLGF